MSLIEDTKKPVDNNVPIDNNSSIEDQSIPDEVPQSPNDDGNDSEKDIIITPVQAESLPTPKDPIGLRSILTRALTKQSYECMICRDYIYRRNYIWSCSMCFAPFHLNCIRRWADTSTAKFAEMTTKVGLSWRCPGCQDEGNAFPSQYRCFCSKVPHPPYIKKSVPHSCGEKCGKYRNLECNHPCTELCHPGPCPPCLVPTKTITCHCGKKDFSFICNDGPACVKSCGSVCGNLLRCSKHTCPLTCHTGNCPPCESEEISTCYCGNDEKPCYQVRGRPEPTVRPSPDGKEPEWVIGFYSCSSNCQEKMSCGVHQCNRRCHPIDDQPPLCWRSPDFIFSCPCGKTPLDTMYNRPRTKCTDSIPTCKKKCGKPHFGCGHPCRNTCHDSACPPCTQPVKISCKCGSKTKSLPCDKSQLDFTCDRVCGRTKRCGRHKCTNVCCPAYSKNSIDEEGLHNCNQVCGKLLNCGKHFCEQQCHFGECFPCMVTLEEDLVCHCGRTRVETPILCGTQLPPCDFPCRRERECGHSVALTHLCHSDTITCPPCSYLTTKKCMCGKKDVQNVPCYRKSPSCGEICGKMRGCGIHQCPKRCHTGECGSEKEDGSCGQLCRVLKRGCGHACEDLCHPDYDCSHTDCRVKLMLKCECGARKSRAQCIGQPVDCQMLECNDSCTKTSSHPQGPLQYDLYVFAFTRNNLKWVKEIEQKIVEFVCDHSKPTLSFKPMKQPFRVFIHCVATEFGLISESLDQEPYRSVVLRKGWRNATIPRLFPSQVYNDPKRYGKPSRLEDDLILEI